MHQHPRPLPGRGTSNKSTSVNPAPETARTHAAPEQPSITKTRSSVDLAAYTERMAGEGAADRVRMDEMSSSQEKDNKRLHQIIQNFHSKAALLICAARASLPSAVDKKTGEVKQNRWFNVVLDDTDVLVDSLLEWRRPDLLAIRPPPLVIEIYLDSSQLAHNQVLVVSDEAGKRWDVSDALSEPTMSSHLSAGHHQEPYEIIVERWTIALNDGAGHASVELNDLLPNIYKKGVVLFRSLYTLLRMLPAWRLHRRLARLPGGQQNLRLKYRIRPARASQRVGMVHGNHDTLFTPLFPSQRSLFATDGEHVRTHLFDPLKCPAGLLQIAVDYRDTAMFSAAEAESLLSSRFLGIDGGMPIPQQAGRSLPGSRSRQTDAFNTPYGSGNTVDRVISRQPRGLLGAYGSLGTFHAPEKRGSPVTELRQRVIYHDEDDETAEESRSRSPDGRDRPRTSIDLIRNPPFKAGSLTSTPPRSSPLARNAASPSSSSNYASSQTSDYKSSSTHNRVPSNTSRPSAAPTMLGQTKKYSSSFSDRRTRYVPGSFGSASRKPSGVGGDNSGGEDSRPPSGDLSMVPGVPSSYGSRRQSSAASSIARPGADAVDDDMDSISQFIHDLDEAAKHSRENMAASTHSARHSAKAFSVDLGQFSKYRTGNTSLAQEMQKGTSVPTPPSRRLSNVPGLSTSSSPRGLAHTPVVRSRLSTQSVLEEVGEYSREGLESPGTREEEDEDEEPFIFGHDMD